ncbi:MAG TPA: hypothetical protein VGI70_09475 [Polyangiales bacterium]|jgi:ElaB/YqjD/DUF883 family membrane-anchored ribosome-binding protein
MTQNTNKPEHTKKPNDLDPNGRKNETAKKETGPAAKLDEARSALTDDIKALSDKFSGSHIKDEAKQAVVSATNATVDKIVEVKDSAAEKLGEAKDVAVEKLTDAKDAALEMAQDAGEQAKEIGGATLRFARANAMPLALIGIGAGWLISSRRARTPSNSSALTTPKRATRARYANGSGYQVGHRELPANGERDLHPGRMTTSAADVKATVKAKTRQLGEKVQRSGASMKAGIKRAGNASLEYADDNPLMVAAVSMAAGVGIGMLLPATSYENRWFGATRDELFGEARDTAHGLSDVVRETVDQTSQALRG